MQNLFCFRWREIDEDNKLPKSHLDSAEVKHTKNVKRKTSRVVTDSTIDAKDTTGDVKNSAGETLASTNDIVDSAGDAMVSWNSEEIEQLGQKGCDDTDIEDEVCLLLF